MARTGSRGPLPAPASLAGGLFFVAACAGGEATGPPDVLLVCLDTVRADRLGCYGYRRHATSPHLDALASESIVFADASAVASWTKPSVPSFLTGTWPLEHGVYEGSARGRVGEVTDLLPEKAFTLAEAFAGAGYATAAFVHNAQLRQGHGFEQGFERYEEGNFDAREIRWRAQDWLDERSDRRPFFLYLHFLDAHLPCPVPDEYAGMFAAGADLSPFRGDGWRALRDDVNDGRRTLDAAGRGALEALYDGAIRYIDDELGRLLRALERRDSGSDLIVCVIADHGEELLENGRMGHGHSLSEILLRVPWILRVPGRPSARVEEPVRLIDVFPTLLAACGIEARTSAGVDRLAARPEATAVFAEHKEPGAYIQSWRQGSWKLVRRFFPAPAGPQPAEVPGLPTAGTRWEAEVLAPAPGRLRATKLSPRLDPPADPVEVKGPAEVGGDGRLRVSGVEVRITSETEVYGETTPRAGDGLGAGPAAPVDGTMIKAVGAFSGGEFVARRIKLYPTGEPTERAIRGPVEDARGDRQAGRLRIGEVWIEWDAAVLWSDPAGARAPALTREDVAEIARLGGAEAARSGFRVESRFFDLASDPLERAPVDDPARAASLAEALDEFARRRIERRIWGEADRAVLKPDAVEALRGLGYVR